MRRAGRLRALRPPLSIRLRTSWPGQSLTEADLCQVAKLAGILPPPNAAGYRPGFASRFEMYQVPRLPARLSIVRLILDLPRRRFRPFPPDATERASPSRRVETFGRAGAAPLLALSLQRTLRGHGVRRKRGADPASNILLASMLNGCPGKGQNPPTTSLAFWAWLPTPFFAFHSLRRKSRRQQISEQSIRRRRLRLEPAAARRRRLPLDRANP